MSDAMRDLVMARPPAQEFERRAARLSPGSLREAGLRQAAEGVTTLEEIARVINRED